MQHLSATSIPSFSCLLVCEHKKPEIPGGGHCRNHIGVLSCPMVGTRTSKARVHGCRDGKHKLMK